MMFAKSEDVSEAFRSHWNEVTEKTYRARVEGLLESEEGVFESYLQEDADGYKVRSVPAPTQASKRANSQKPAKLARTEWKRLSTGRRWSR